MNLKEQKEKVLQMLKEDKITQTEALDLLELISAQKEEHVEEEENTSERQEKILLSFPEMPENFWDNDLQKFEVFADTDFKIIKKLALVGKNGEIDIKTHHKPSIEIEGTFKAVRNNNLKVDFEERNGNYRLNYDYNSVRFMSLSVKIPEDKLNELHLETSNAMISLTNIKANKAKLNTRNGEIKLKNLDIDSLEATTRNSKIMLREVRAEKAELTTKNAQINVTRLVSDYAEMTTKNDSVSINDSFIKSAAIQTKNANVWYDLSTNKIIDNYLIEAGTANADIVIILPEVDSLAYKLKASTKRGVIIPVGDQFVESASNNGNLIGKTENYDHKEGKIDMVLETRNANIVLKSED